MHSPCRLLTFLFLHRQLPYLVGNVVELLDLDPTAESSEEGANIDLDATRVGKSAVIKTSTRQTIFLPLIGLVDPNNLKPGDLIGVNKDSYLILDTLPAEYDSRVKAMEVDEKPTEKYSDVGGLDKQIEELVEAIVWPMKEAERFKKIGIKAPKGKYYTRHHGIPTPCSQRNAKKRNYVTGALMYGPPGTGKTLLARACAAQTDATFLKLAGPQLVQMFIGDGAKLVRDCFALAKEKAPSIIFIDELDAVGTKRFDSEKSGDREVQRTMLELLNQLDGFASDDRIKVLAATNRVDVLDPALLRSGRLDRKIEFPLPNEEARAQILKIHSRKMKVDPGINWGELARSTDEFGGAMLKAVCVEAGMIALRMGKNKISHEHYVDAIAEVQAKKKEVSFPNNASLSAHMSIPLTTLLARRPSTSTLRRLVFVSAEDRARRVMFPWSQGHGKKAAHRNYGRGRRVLGQGSYDCRIHHWPSYPQTNELLAVTSLPDTTLPSPRLLRLASVFCMQRHTDSSNLIGQEFQRTEGI